MLSRATWPGTTPSLKAMVNRPVRLVSTSTRPAASTAPYALLVSWVAVTVPTVAWNVSVASAEKNENCAMLHVVSGWRRSPRLIAAATAPTRKPTMIAQLGEKNSPITRGAADMPTGRVLRRAATASGQRSVMKKSAARPQAGSTYVVDTAGSGSSILIHTATAGSIRTNAKSRSLTAGPENGPSGCAASVDAVGTSTADVTRLTQLPIRPCPSPFSRALPAAPSQRGYCLTIRGRRCLSHAEG